MKYDVWQVNGYDETEKHRIGEHLEKEEVRKMITDPDNFDCMYVPKVYVENTMDDVTRYFTKNLKYVVVECEARSVDSDEEGEFVIGIYKNRDEAEAALKQTEEKNGLLLGRLYYTIRLRMA